MQRICYVGKGQNGFEQQESKLLMKIDMKAIVDSSFLFIYTFANKWPHRLMARTSGSHPENRGSTPRGVTMSFITILNTHSKPRKIILHCLLNIISIIIKDMATKNPCFVAGIFDTPSISEWSTLSVDHGQIIAYFSVSLSFLE